MHDEIIPADKKLRNRVVMGTLLTALVALTLGQFLSSYVRELKSLADIHPELAVVKAKDFLFYGTLVHVGLSSAFGLYFLIIGIRIWNRQRYPLEGQRVIRDTKLRTGRSARLMAIIHFVVAGLLISTNIIMIRLYVFISSLRR